MSTPPPIDPIEECVRLAQEVELYKTLLKQRDAENAETLDAAVKIEDERNQLKREIAALREANARAAERIREEQQRTERLVKILRRWNQLCEMGLMDVTKEWVRPAIMELWELTDEALPAEPDQVPTEHTEGTESDQATSQATTKDTKDTKREAL